MTTMKSTAIAAGVAVGAGMCVGPALAHPGPHHGMSFGELAQHLATGWHLLMLGGAATAIGVAVLFVVQRREAKVQPAARKPGGRT